MLGNASDLTIINTGKVYVLYDDFGKLCLKPYESLLLPLYIDEDTAQGYSYTSSIDSDVYNRIKLAWDNDETGVREVHVMNNAASQSKWGVLQYYEKLDNALEYCRPADQGQGADEILQRHPPRADHAEGFR